MVYRLDLTYIVFWKNGNAYISYMGGGGVCLLFGSLVTGHLFLLVPGHLYNYVTEHLGNYINEHLGNYIG